MAFSNVRPYRDRNSKSGLCPRRPRSSQHEGQVPASTILIPGVAHYNRQYRGGNLAEILDANCNCALRLSLDVPSRCADRR